MTESIAMEHSMLGTFVLPVAQALRLYGCDPVEELAAVDIDLARAANPEWRIPPADFNALMHHCEKITGDEAFGLVAAEKLQPQVLHGLGLAWLASDTVYDGLTRLVRFGSLISTGMVLRLAEEGEFVHLQLGALALERPAWSTRDYGVGMIARMCHLTLGEFLAPVSVRLERPAPAEPERWEYTLACRVTFDAGDNRVTWAGSDIREPLVTGDPALARVNDEQTQAYLDGFLVQTLSREVVDKIVEHLPDGPPSQQQIAESLHVSSRTLQRRLKEEGTSFMDLLRDTRLQLARKYLRQPSRSVVETAYMLGFSEPSTFSRAFKRWTGEAPGEYREAAREAAREA
jgi:AraC-like DNA-binding protein